MPNTMITALGFYAVGLYYLYARWHEEHKWTFTACFFATGVVLTSASYASGSLVHFLADSIAAVLMVFAASLAADYIEGRIRKLDATGRLSALGRRLARWTALFIVVGLAYMQVLAWVEPNSQESPGDFYRFVAVFAAVSAVFWLFGKLDS